jgi:hypothetical protein
MTREEIEDRLMHCISLDDNDQAKPMLRMLTDAMLIDPMYPLKFREYKRMIVRLRKEVFGEQR